MAFAPNASEADRREESDDAMLIREWPNEPRQALSADTLTKRLDSARREVRGYRTLYFTLFGFGLLSLSPISAIYHSSSCTGSPNWLIISVATWTMGILSLLFGSVAMLPKVRYPDRSANEFLAIAGTEHAIHASDEASAQAGLIAALEATHEIQQRVVARGSWVFLGATLIMVSVGLAFGWLIACHEVTP